MGMELYVNHVLLPENVTEQQNWAQAKITGSQNNVVGLERMGTYDWTSQHFDAAHEVVRARHLRVEDNAHHQLALAQQGSNVDEMARGAGQQIFGILSGL
ncbi:hypothetical protein ACFCV3_08205 [Kribbella sp. NPDC056345]|uniref:hypothetical protein n=1 Tax=Kribbella sp. NPDC056345 TaxID=3345789 RepID=UPI0035D8E5A6